MCGGRRVNRRRVSKNTQQARKEERKRGAKRSLKVDPANMSGFKEKLVAGDLDENDGSHEGAQRSTNQRQTERKYQGSHQ